MVRRSSWASPVPTSGQALSPEATLALTRALGDPSPVIRILALEALASRGGDGQEAVRSALQSGDPLLRARAAELLAHARGDDGN